MQTAVLMPHQSNPQNQAPRPPSKLMSRWKACEETRFETVKRLQRRNNSAQGRHEGRRRVLVGQLRVLAGRARAVHEAEAQLRDNRLHRIRDLTEIRWKFQKCEF